MEKATAWGPEEQASFLRVYCSTAVVRDQASFRQLGQTTLASGEVGQKADNTCWAVRLWEPKAGFLFGSAASCPADK